jgi:hypothetical protein
MTKWRSLRHAARALGYGETPATALSALHRTLGMYIVTHNHFAVEA